MSLGKLFRGMLESPYLKQVCGDNHELFDRVSALVQIRGQQPGFLETPASALAPTLDTAPIAERLGTYIGPYKLVEEIGEGGMGSVFMAAAEGANSPQGGPEGHQAGDGLQAGRQSASRLSGKPWR